MSRVGIEWNREESEVTPLEPAMKEQGRRRTGYAMIRNGVEGS